MSHGRPVSGLTFGLWSFSVAFEDGHELNTSLVPTADGRIGLRVFWEKW